MVELHAQRATLDCNHALIVRLPFGRRIHEPVDDLALLLIGMDVLFSALHRIQGRCQYIR